MKDDYIRIDKLNSLLMKILSDYLFFIWFSREIYTFLKLETWLTKIPLKRVQI